MAARVPYFTRLARAVENEIATSARVIAKRLPFADDSPDAVKMTREELIQHVQTQSETPGFLQSFLDRLAPLGPDGTRPLNGLKKYLAIIEASRPDLYQQGTGQTPDSVLALPGTLSDQDIRVALGLDEFKEEPMEETDEYTLDEAGEPLWTGDPTAVSAAMPEEDF